MKKGQITKIIALAVAVASLIGAAIAISASAEETKPQIIAQNVAYEGDFALMYAVDAATATAPVSLYLYTEAPTKDSVAHKKYVVEEVTAASGNLKKDSYIFKTEGVAAKDMADVFYVQAVDANGNKSDVVRYSVGEYLYERLATEGISKAQENLYYQTLYFGAAAQAVLAPSTTPITSYRYVQVKGGLLSDGYKAGIYPIGTEITPVGDGVYTWDVYSYADDKTLTQTTINAGESFDLSGVTIVVGSTEKPLPVGTETFDKSTSIPSFVGKTLGSGGSLAVVPVERDGKTTNALKYGATNDGTNDFVRFNPTHTEENADTVIYEFDMLGGNNLNYEMIIRDMDGNQIFRFFLESATVDGVAYAYVKDVTNTGTGYNFWSCKMGKATEWINIKIVFTPDPYTRTERFTIYYNGTAVAQATTGLYVTYNNEFRTADQLGIIDFRAQGSTVNEMYFDNVRVAKIKNEEKIYPMGSQDFESIAIGGTYSKWSVGKAVVREDMVYNAVSKVLYFQPDTDGVADTYNMYANSTALSVDRANAYGFSADIKFSKGQSGENIAYDFMVDKGGTAVFWLRFISSDGKVYIQNQKNTSEKFEIAVLDEYFNFQAAYVYMGGGVSVVHIVSNGTYIGTFTSMQNSGDFPLADMTNFRFRTMSKYDYHAYMDNAFLGYCYIEQ